METDEERRARLERRSDNQHLRLSTETHDKRAARLERRSDNQHLRLAAETHDKRAARLERLSANQILRLAAETDDEREARMQRVAALMQQRRDLDERLPLHEQHHVQAAMHSFHAEMSSVQIPTRSTCMETFPGMKINSRTHQNACDALVTGVSPNCIPLPTTCTQVQYQRNYRLDYKVVLFAKLTLVCMKFNAGTPTCRRLNVKCTDLCISWDK